MMLGFDSDRYSLAPVARLMEELNHLPRPVKELSLSAIYLLLYHKEVVE